MLLSAAINAQNVEQIFKSMPANLLPGASEGNRTMLLVDSSTTSVPYAFGEIKKIVHSENYLKIETSKAGSTQLKLLPFEGDSLLVCVIKTVCAGACDSYFSFYTTNWEKMDSDKFLPNILPELFYDSSKKGEENYKYAVSLPDIYPISASFETEGTDLTLKLNIKERLTQTQLDKIKPYLKSDSVVLKWNNGTFK